MGIRITPVLWTLEWWKNVQIYMYIDKNIFWWDLMKAEVPTAPESPKYPLTHRNLKPLNGYFGKQWRPRWNEMQHNASALSLLRLKQPTETEIHHNLENSTCDPLKCISMCMGKPIRIQNRAKGKKLSTDVVCATSKASDQPVHMRSLIRAFASHLNILWI